VLHWLVEAAEQLRAFAAYFLCDLHLEQLQLDEVYAVLRDSKPARSARMRRSSVWRAPPLGCGRRWTPRISCWWLSMSAVVPWPWRSAWCIR
jgi:hypothetical protein